MRPYDHRQTHDHRADARHLRIAHSEINAGIDADKFHQEASQTGKHQVVARKFAGPAAFRASIE